MIKLLLEPVNFLILDEPTNHLDMRTKDILKEAIRDFNGTVIVVSHDREFLDGLVEKVYEFGNGRVKEHLGGIYDFLHRRQLTSLTDLERVDKGSLRHTPVADMVEAGSDSRSLRNDEKTERKLSYAEQKERERMLRRAEKNVTSAETEIARLEGVVADYEKKIADGDCSSEILSGYDDARRQLDNAMSVWELAQEELDNLK